MQHKETEEARHRTLVQVEFWAFGIERNLMDKLLMMALAKANALVPAT